MKNGGGRDEEGAGSRKKEAGGSRRGEKACIVAVCALAEKPYVFAAVCVWKDVHGGAGMAGTRAWRRNKSLDPKVPESI